jgi:LysR family carnitine catabolism transcriptional activator
VDNDADNPSADRLPGLTLRQLRHLVTLAELRSFTRAAQALSISQPALTASIRQAEFLLGGQLFDRSSHRLTLTGAGALVLPLAERLLNVARLSFNDMSLAVTQGVQTVRIGLIPSVAEKVTAHLIALQAQEPSVRFTLQDMANSDLIEAVQARRVDFGIGARERRAADAGLVCQDLFRDDIIIVMRADDALASHDQLAWADLVDRPLAVFVRGNVADSLLRTAEEMGLELNVAFRMEYTEPIYALVRNRLAMAIMPRLYTEQLHDPGLVVRALRAPHVKRGIALLATADDARSPQVMLCRSWIVNALRQAPSADETPAET